MADVSVVIPVYNERSTMRELIGRVLGQSGMIAEIIVVDDGSTDGTRDLLKEIERENAAMDRPRLRVLYKQKNEGKGSALAAGFKEVTGDIVIVQDADLEYNPRDYSKLIKPILDGEADVVYGSRFGGEGPHRVLYFWHYVGNKVLTALSNVLTNLNLRDMESCYKVFRKEVLSRIDIKEKGFGFEPEITAKVANLGCRIYEVGISYSGRTYGEGKKIGWKDGVWALWCIVKYRLF